MALSDDDPVLPWRIPAAVIVLLIVVIVAISLGALALVGALTLGAVGGVPTGLDLAWPDGQMARVAWVQGMLTMAVLFVLWLFSILVVAAHVSGMYRNAAASAVAMVRATIAIVLVQFAVGALTPVVLVDSWRPALAALAAGGPMVLAKIALLIAADAHFRAIRQNAPQSAAR